jgi:LacI family transcriptional regulator
MTITEIAKLANVSKSSVSLVLNNKPGVSAETREKVRAIIKKYRYRPNQVAQSLAGGETKSIGLVTKEIDNPYFSRMTRGVNDVCSRLGYSLLLGCSEQSLEREREIIITMVSKRVDGLIICPLQSEDSDYAYVGDLLKDSYPLVVLGTVGSYTTNVVDIDNFQAAYDAVSYLIQKGHTEIAYLAGPVHSGHGKERLDAYKQALSDNGIPVQRSRIVHAKPYVAEGVRAGKELLAGSPQVPSAIFCYNDLIAIGLLRVLEERGLEVPGRVSVMGFDNIDIDQYLQIPLTTIDQPSYEMGKTAANMLIKQIAAGTAGARFEKTILPHRIIERKSVANIREPISISLLQ